MKAELILGVVWFSTLFAIIALPVTNAGIGSGPFDIVVTAGNWNLEIIDVQFTNDGHPVGPLYNVNTEVQSASVETIGPFSPGDDPNSLEITYLFAATTYVYIVPPDWAGVGVELDKTYTMITAIGEPLTYPLVDDPEGDTTIMVSLPVPEFPLGTEVAAGIGLMAAVVCIWRRRHKNKPIVARSRIA